MHNPTSKILDKLRHDVAYLISKKLIVRRIHESDIPGGGEKFFITKKGLKLVQKLQKKRKLEKLVA